MATLIDNPCDVGIVVTQVYPNSATTVFTVLLQSTCATGLVTDGTITATTITKIGKENSKVLITAIPKNGSVFKGWTTDISRGVPGRSGAESDASFNWPINNGTTWYALFDKDCSYGSSEFCFNTDKDKLCSSCEEQKTVYFDNRDNLYINKGITINTYWYASKELETLITYSSSDIKNRSGWSFNISSTELTGGGTFNEVFQNRYDGTSSCNRDVGTKQIILNCTPSTLTTQYIVYIYKNNVKLNSFTRTGNSNITVLNLNGNPGTDRGLSDVYQLKYVCNGTQTVTFTINAKTKWEKENNWPRCNGGYIDEDIVVYTRPRLVSLISPDGFYSQVINGYYSQYSVIYQISNGLIIDKSYCGSDILECNGGYSSTGLIDPVTIKGTNYNRTWSSKNLDITRYNNLDSIPLVTGATEWAKLTTGAYCYYNNDPANSDTYGLLYNWYAVNDKRGLAPTGWKIPTMGDWNEMVYALNPKLGGKLKEIGTTHWLTPNSGATNETGFTALPGGLRNVSFMQSGINMGSNVFQEITKTAYFWSSSSTQTITANHVYITHLSDLMSGSNWGKSSGMSIRLIRN